MNTNKIFSIELTVRKVFIAICLAGIVLASIAEAGEKRSASWWSHFEGPHVTIHNMESGKKPHPKSQAHPLQEQGKKKK